MTTTNEDLLALADRLDGIEIYSVRANQSILGTRPIEAANNAVCEAAAALRAIVAERQKPQHGKEVMPNDEDNSHERPAVSPRLTAGAQATIEAAKAAAQADYEARILSALDVSGTPVLDHQRDLVTADERQAIRDKALDDAAQCCEAEADKCDDAVKWGGAPKYIANCKAAAYAMRDRAAAIRAMKGKPE